ncbi:DNA ligase 4 [Nymphaea thermarum]|nr:DNA ligase 4 [Nymphaea thermarum]
MSDDTVKFSVLCSMFQAMVRAKSPAMKRKHFRTFLDHVYRSREYFSAIRLVLPALDRERGTYGLKESTLATCLIDAVGMSRESPDAVRLINWRKGGARVGANVGNFALVAFEILQARQGVASAGITIKELNDLLDRLASAEKREEKTAVLSELIKKTNAQEMKWILMIILKDLKLGVSEKSVFHEFHPDAEDLFNVTCDLKLVCEKLKDRTQRNKRQDIEVGKAVRPQLALRVSDVNAAWKKLHGKQVVAECKFDGDRIQIHKNGSEIHFFSRNFLDHSEYGHGMSEAIENNILADRVILDGEMLVWDTTSGRFAEFGSNQEIDVAFDILYVGDTSVIHQSLKERHELLRKVVKPIKGRLEILVPDGGLNANRPSGEPCWSLLVYSVGEVEKFFKETIENRDEGIVLKDLGSKWEPSDRSGKWLKLKPDYVHAEADLDVLIIGGYFGSGRRGGEVGQFLVGLAERSTSSSHPTRFFSFCRVGSGLSDDELDVLISKLKPYFRRNENSKTVPNFYITTNNAKERPDVWIDNPERSIILSITSDIRTIKSEVFASPYSLRFPRIQRVRYDKPWYECLDVQSFVDLVHSSNGNTQHGMHVGTDQITKERSSSSKRQKRTLAVPSQFIQTDVSDIKEQNFVNFPPTYSLDFFHKLVVENGGSFSMNLNDSVTHCIAAERKGIKYQAAACRGDVIHYSWVLDCCSQKRLLHLQPKYLLFLSDSSKEKLRAEVDTLGDSHFLDLDVRDIKQLFDNMHKVEYSSSNSYYKKKYFPTGKWSLFWDCCIYFCQPLQSVDLDMKVLSEIVLRRLKLDVSIYGGKISSNIADATHLVVVSCDEFHMDFDKILESFPASMAPILRSEKLHVLGNKWLEDSIVDHKKVEEQAYNLRPKSMELSGSDLLLPATDDNEAVALASHAKEGPKRRELVQLPRKRGGVKPTGRGNQSVKIKTGEQEGNGLDGDVRVQGLDKGKEPLDDKLAGTQATLPSNHVRTGTKRRLVQVPRKRRAAKPARLAFEPADISTSEEGSPGSDGARTKEGLTQGEKVMNDGNMNRANMDAIEHAQLDVAGVPTELKQEAEGSIDAERANLEGKGPEKNPIFEEEKGPVIHRTEVMSDPLHAMLLDMIPGLRTKNDNGKSLAQVKENHEATNSEAPAKKKKVSYRDMVGALLKD